MVAVAVGPERIVNTIDDGDQYRPFITGLASGGYVVSWQDASGLGSPPGDVSDDVRFAVYDAFGTRLSSGDPIANTEKQSAQFETASAAYADGRFVMVWTDSSATSPDFNNKAVRAQVFNADGSKSGSAFIVNQTYPLSQEDPSVAVLANGNFVVTWTAQDINASSTTDIIGRIFSPSGSPVTGEFAINGTFKAGDQGNSTVISLRSGGFAVVWDDRFLDINPQTKTVIRFFSANGSPQGTEFVANTANAGDPQFIDVDELADNRVVVTWTENQTAQPGDGSGASIRARIFNPVTETWGAAIRVNTTKLNDQTDAQVAALNDGQWVVVWTDASRTPGEDDSFTAVRMQVFDAAGKKVGTEILVNAQTTFEQENPVITVLKDGRFVVAWQDNSQTGTDQLGFSIRSRIYDARVAAIDIDGTEGADSYQGTSFSDVIDGLGGSDVIKAGNGNDFIFGGLGIDLLFGNTGNDRLDGGAGDDELEGGSGNDRLDGGTGDDKMTGGDGDDTYYVDSVLDVVIELPNKGLDTVRTTLISYVLPANVERLFYDGTLKISAKGNGLDNTLRGGAGNDVFLVDQGGADAFIGGAGNDTMDFRLSAAGATVNLATGVHAGAAAGDSFSSVETFFGSATASDSLTGADFAITFYGGGGDDTLTGSTAGDLLSGGDNNDTLKGRAGEDTLLGGRGNDKLTGGASADVFWFDTPTSSGGFGTDTITDFQDGSDKIRFALQVAGSMADFTISGNNSTTVTITMAEGTIIVKSAAAVTLTAADFIFG